MITVRVGIVSWNSADHLGRCLDALPGALAGSEAEVIVVDNASSDASVEVASRPGVRVISNADNRGYAVAMNQALLGDADVLIALNPDTVAPPGSLTVLVERLRADGGLGLIVPRLVDADGRQQPSVYRFPSAVVTLASTLPVFLQRGRLGARLWLEPGARYESSTDIEWAIGAVHVIRADALGVDPPYSERWFMYGEDIELCWRLAGGGWRRRLEADVAVAHVGNASGELAWGPDRDRRWVPVTYDVIRRTRGVVAMRIWGLANSAGIAALVLRQLIALPVSRRRAQRLEIARAMARRLPIHLRAATVGPPPPDQKPPPSPRRLETPRPGLRLK